MLQVNNIEVTYMNIIQVLHGVSLEVGDGKIIALLGANGAGKTTTLKAISGLLKTEEGEVTDGSIVFDGKRIDRYGPGDIAATGITQVMEGRRVLGHLSVEENLMVFAHNRKDRGEQQMLVIGRGLMASPKLMLLDEPSLGLAPIMVQEIYEIIRRINEERKIAILLVEQNARAALGIADYGYVMENGRVVLSGAADMLRDNKDVQEFYMGLSTVGSKRSYREVKHYRRKKRWLT
jgi:branched-chain amino acid transport system ATP-binding protein